jgi:hypothetical protein
LLLEPTPADVSILMADIARELNLAIGEGNQARIHRCMADLYMALSVQAAALDMDLGECIASSFSGGCH